MLSNDSKKKEKKEKGSEGEEEEDSVDYFDFDPNAKKNDYDFRAVPVAGGEGKAEANGKGDGGRRRTRWSRGVWHRRV